MSETIRAFIAMELEASLQEDLKKIQDRLKTSYADVKGRPFGSPLARGITTGKYCINPRAEPVASDAVKWVTAGNIHLTLKFLGNISSEKVEQLKRALPSLLGGFSDFEITIDHLGAFPNARRPRVIWVGINRNADKVIEIAKILEEKLSHLGFEKEERAFSAHLTLGRVRSSQNLNRLCQVLQDYKFPSPLQQTVKSITLFQSTLTPHGSIYTPLLEIHLERSR